MPQSSPASPPRIEHVRDLLARLDAQLRPLGLSRPPEGNQWTGSAFARVAEVVVMLDRRTQYLSEDLRLRQTLGARVRVNVQCATPSRLYFVPGGFADSWLVRLLYRLRRFTVSAGPMPWVRSVTDTPVLAQRVVHDARAVELLQTLIGMEPHAHAASASTYVDNGRLWASSARLYGDSAAVFDGARQLATAAALAERVEQLAAP